MTKQEIINQLKAQLEIAKKEFRGSKMLYALADALNLIDKQELETTSKDTEKLEKKLKICEMNKEILKKELEELKK